MGACHSGGMVGDQQDLLGQPDGPKPIAICAHARNIVIDILASDIDICLRVDGLYAVGAAIPAAAQCIQAHRGIACFQGVERVVPTPVLWYDNSGA